MNNKDKIKLEHALDQLKACHEPMLNQVIKQAEEIDNALNELYNADNKQGLDEIEIIIAGQRYKLGLWHTDVCNIVGCSLQDIINFAKSEMT